MRHGRANSHDTLTKPEATRHGEPKPCTIKGCDGTMVLTKAVLESFTDNEKNAPRALLRYVVADCSFRWAIAR